jgi:hypothetical protein
MFKISKSQRSRLAAAIAGVLILITPIAPAGAKSGGSKASIITSDQGGGGTKGPVVRNHRGEQNRTRPVRHPSTICAGWFC